MVHSSQRHVRALQKNTDTLEEKTCSACGHVFSSTSGRDNHLRQKDECRKMMKKKHEFWYEADIPEGGSYLYSLFIAYPISQHEPKILESLRRLKRNLYKLHKSQSKHCCQSGSKNWTQRSMSIWTILISIFLRLHSECFTTQGLPVDSNLNHRIRTPWMRTPWSSTWRSEWSMVMSSQMKKQSRCTIGGGRPMAHLRQARDSLSPMLLFHRRSNGSSLNGLLRRTSMEAP